MSKLISIKTTISKTSHPIVLQKCTPVANGLRESMFPQNEHIDLTFIALPCSNLLDRRYKFSKIFLQVNI